MQRNVLEQKEIVDNALKLGEYLNLRPAMLANGHRVHNAMGPPCLALLRWAFA